MENSMMPFAIYQFIDKRVVTVALSKGFCKLFGYEDRARAYYDMDNDMYKDVHPDDVARVANAAYRFATEGGRYETDTLLFILRKLPEDDVHYSGGGKGEGITDIGKDSRLGYHEIIQPVERH